ncbi:hypothetical protein [Pedobacter gandavensis]|uniref:phosphoribosyltransferase-like protein n=1 Tax=Pedobacter gandavensis TaxID=2679963 RepID=UPI00292D112F|nr:hypothetical protein [Pedobacter gandavensis]
MGITIENLGKLESLFETKKWEIIKESDKYSSIFNRFCARLGLFDEKKQDLLIELGHEFLNIPFNEYQDYFLGALKKIDKITDYDLIIISPLKTRSPIESKSADAVWYSLKRFDYTYESLATKLKFESNWDNIKKLLTKPKSILILVDDFIGTGGTVRDILDELHAQSLILKSDKIMVLTFVAQLQGIKYINSVYPSIVTCTKILNRGISDNYTGLDKIEKLALMDEIEKKLKVRDSFRLGYGKSESLFAITDRSANNTFPVFWLEESKQLAPFKR